MSVYVDPLMKWPSNSKWKYKESCHLTADKKSELFAFAYSIGLKADWYQPKSFPHFDLTRSKRALAISQGAVELSTREFVLKAREIRERGEFDG